MKDEQFGRSRPYLQYLLLGLLLVLLWAFQSAPANLCDIAMFRPMPAVVLLICIGIVYGEMAGGAFGLFAGLLMDLYATPSTAFHVVVLTALGILCGLAVKHWLMNNLLSAVVLWLVGSVLYFVLYWLLFKVILGDDGWFYLYRYALHDGVYTAVFGTILMPLVVGVRRQV